MKPVECRVGKETSNVTVEVGALGAGLQQILKSLEGNAGVLIDGSVAELHLKNRAPVIVRHVRQRGRLYGYRIPAMWSKQVASLANLLC